MSEALLDPRDAAPRTWTTGLGWALTALACVTPLVVVFRLVRPLAGQSYFFELGVFAALVAVGVAQALGLWQWKRPGMRLSPAHGLVLLNALSVAAAVLVSREPLYSLRQALLPGCAFIWWALLVALPHRRRWIERVTLGFCAVGVLLAIYGILQHLGFEVLPYSEQIRKNNVIATVGHPNYLGSVLGPLVFLLAGMVLTARNRRLWVLGGIGVLLMLVCILLARTRGIWLGILVGGAGWMVLSALVLRRRGLHRLLRTLLASAAIQVLALLTIVFVLLPRFNAGLNLTELRERLGSEMEIKSRLFYWQTAIRQGQAHPLGGVGFGMFNAYFWEDALAQQRSPQGEYFQDVMPSISNRMPGHAHNEYIEVFAEQGWPGLAALLALLLYFAQFGARAVLHEREVRRALPALGAWAALLVMLVDACFSFPWRLPVSLLAMMLVLARLHDEIESDWAAPAPEPTRASEPMPAIAAGRGPLTVSRPPVNMP